MKTLRIVMLLTCAALLTSSGEGARFFRIAGPVATTITSFSADGYVTWTNTPTNTTFTVQMTTSLGGGSNWVDYVRIPATNSFTTSRLIDPNPPAGLAWIPAGLFKMGSPTNEAERQLDEVQHTVTLTKGFYMGKYEVTQGQYLAVVGSNPSYFQTIDKNGTPISPDLSRPVETVSWYEATNYCALLTQSDQMAGRIPSNWVYRLPTDSEREHACRAGTTTAFYFGSAIHGGMANFYDYNEYDAAIGTIYVASPSIPWLPRTTTVGSYVPNAFGLYDMHGNVSEWCQDWYGPYSNEAVIDPTGPAAGSDRVIRGGFWHDFGWVCRSAFRYYFSPADKFYGIGFRVVLAPSQP